MRVAVFGRSQTQPGSPAYADAENLGRGLAALGHTVMTGGYTGTMEAVSRGAASGGGHVIGVTCGEIERSHRRHVNQWVAEEWSVPTLMERLQKLVAGSDAALALPGGPGTLTEVALTWNLMIVQSIGRRPLILIGPGWEQVLKAMYGTLGAYVSPAQRELVSFAADIPVALDVVASYN
jgi:uncharacterized protein (TIGR00730 family)